MANSGTPGWDKGNMHQVRIRHRELTMHFDVKCLPEKLKMPPLSVDRGIRDFLAGKSNGEDLLHALYDHVLDEPVPQRLRAVLQG